MSEDSIEFSLSIAEQRAVGFIPAWSLAFLQEEYGANLLLQGGDHGEELLLSSQ